MNQLSWFIQSFMINGLMDGFVNKSRKKAGMKEINNFHLYA
jgi:hypothetical protein